MATGYQNLCDALAFQQLNALSKNSMMTLTLNASRLKSMTVSMGTGLFYNYAAKLVDEPILTALQNLADEMDVVGQYRQLIAGAVMNSSEQRMVLHHLTRGQLGPAVIWQGRDKRLFYEEQLQRISAFSERIHTGQLCGGTGKRFRHVCQIGIGGSALGPRSLYLALAHGAQCRDQQYMTASFITNVDPDNAGQVLAELDLVSTLFIVVSKSGTTQETLTNEALVCHALQQAGLDPAAHLVAVTSEACSIASGVNYLEHFYLDDFIGGRFSSTSVVGATLLTLTFGANVFAALLDGAHHQDTLALNPCVTENPALLDALIGIYERNCLGYGCSAVLPYSQPLIRFVAHLQQLDMESNGKSVNREGVPLPYDSGPIIFGEPGTNGQHSFYQLLHQGTQVVPLQFIGFQHSQGGADLQVDGSTSQDKLNANLVAQIFAFANGQPSSDPNTSFAGQRPSSLIYGEQLTPWVLGALLAHFENKVMFQGFLWNINSFDQEGVQLGKRLTQQILTDHVDDEALKVLAEMLAVQTLHS
jgi:glucose-6-phosphate isomerase